MKNIILIDYENVQANNLDPLYALDTKIYVFVGKNQKSITFDLVQSAQKFGDRMEWVKISGNGPNALDFHIACYIGRFLENGEKAYIHIISKDKGFDPLVEHTRLEGGLIARECRIEEIPIIADTLRIKENPIEFIKGKLTKGTKPKRQKTLVNAIKKILALKIGRAHV